MDNVKKLDEQLYQEAYAIQTSNKPIDRLYPRSELEKIKKMIDDYFTEKKIKVKTSRTYFDELAIVINAFNKGNEKYRHVTKSYLANLYFFEKEGRYTKMKASEKESTGLRKNGAIVDNILHFLNDYQNKIRKKHAIESANSNNDLIQQLNKIDLLLERDAFKEAKIEISEIERSSYIENSYIKARLDFSLAIIFRRIDNNWRKARELCFSSLAVFEEYGKKDDIADIRVFLSALHFEDENYMQALTFFEENTSFFIKSKNIKSLGFHYVHFTRFLIYNNDFDLANIVIEKIEKISAKFQSTLHFEYFEMMKNQVDIIESDLYLMISYYPLVLKACANDERKKSVKNNPQEIHIAFQCFELAKSEYKSGNYSFFQKEKNDLDVAVDIFNKRGMFLNSLLCYQLECGFVTRLEDRYSGLNYLREAIMLVGVESLKEVRAKSSTLFEFVSKQVLNRLTSKLPNEFTNYEQIKINRIWSLFPNVILLQ